MPFQKFATADAAARDALQYAGGLSGSENIEFAGAVCCEKCDGNQFYYPKVIAAGAGTVSSLQRNNANARCRQDKVVAIFHSHTPGPVHNGLSSDDKNASAALRDASGPMQAYAVFPNGTLASYRGWDFVSLTPNAIPYTVFASKFRLGMLREADFVE
ncbi:MAG: DUF4329 domain-containing protein [Deltaproteobacteria bacterium]|nr:DUF4329 domain-containing protein [Deltaproteobacteria bacterium]